jgi:hypothetical protein
MKEEAYKLIAAKDAEDGGSWSNDSDEIASIMVSFAKAQLEQLLSDLGSLDQIGVSFDRNWDKCRENYHDSDYVRSEELNAIITAWKAKL